MCNNRLACLVAPFFLGCILFLSSCRRDAPTSSPPKSIKEESGNQYWYKFIDYRAPVKEENLDDTIITESRIEMPVFSAEQFKASQSRCPQDDTQIDKLLEVQNE